MKTKLFLSGLAFMAIATLAGAQNNGAQCRHRACTGNCTAFVDTNKNGICDNYENSARMSAAPKRSGNGNGSAMRQKQQGMGQKQPVMGQARRINYVDSNKNGVCDYYEVGTKK